MPTGPVKRRPRAADAEPTEAHGEPTEAHGGPLEPGVEPTERHVEPLEPLEPPKPLEPLECQRDAFRIPPGEHYLNCAYMGPLPRVAEAAGVEALSAKCLPTRIEPPFDFWRQSDELRRRFARLLGEADPERVAIQPGVSYGVSTAARNLHVERGQNLVITHEQFPGNVYAWRRSATESGAELRVAAPAAAASASRGAQWNERLLEAIDRDTAVVAVPHVHWTDGTRFDLEAVGARCREVGAALVVDATQSLGALPFDLDAVRPDALICATYKWLLGPYGLSLAWYGPRFDDGVPLEETWIARERSDDFQNLVDYRDEYRPGAARYDMAERSSFQLVPVAVASLGLLLEWRPERVQDYCRRLTADMLEEARALGYVVEVERWRACHLFGVRMPASVDLAALRDALARRHVSASLRGSALRLSPNVYNDRADIEALLDVLREAV